MDFRNFKWRFLMVGMAATLIFQNTALYTIPAFASEVSITEKQGEVDWLKQSNFEIDNLNSESVNETSAYELCEKYLDLFARGEITLSDYNTIIDNIYGKYFILGKAFDKSVYQHKGNYRSYMNELQSGKYNVLVNTLSSERLSAAPRDMEITSSQALILEMAKHVGYRWANGLGISAPTNGDTNLRYSQSNYATYTSDLTGESFRVRADCSGFVYTVLRELGVELAKGVGYVPNTQTFSGWCRSGSLALDPRITVLPFDVDSLQPGDIMVASKDERLTRWGTDDAYVNAAGYSIRKGHTEVFVRWLDGKKEEIPRIQAIEDYNFGFEVAEPNSTDDGTHRLMEVYSWGSTGQVNASFLDEDNYTPLSSTKDYNYSYIIRFQGGYDLWQ